MTVITIYPQDRRSYPTYWEYGISLPSPVDCYSCGINEATCELRDYEGHVETRVCGACRVTIQAEIGQMQCAK